MRLYLYKNSLCDPARSIGDARYFKTSSDLDKYLFCFVLSFCRPQLDLRQWRAFVTNDDVEFHEVDHHVLMDEPYKLGINKERIKELDLTEIWKASVRLAMEMEQKNA